MKDKINYKKVNEVVSLTSKILNLVYIAMIIGIIFIATLLIKEWGILKFVMTILKVATPFFIGFVIAWLFNPLVVKLENRGWNRAVASMVIFLVFILIIFAFFSMLIPTIYTQLNDLIASLPGIFNSLKIWITNFLNNFNSKSNKILICQIIIIKFEIYFIFRKTIFPQIMLQNNKNMLGCFYRRNTKGVFVWKNSSN